MKENVKKGKDEGYISFDPEELKNATQEGDPNDEAYELLWEATCVSSHVNDDEKECGHIESDNIYPTTAEEVDRMEELLDKAEKALKEPNIEFSSRVTELREVVKWSRKRHWKLQWKVIAGVILSVIILHLFADSKQGDVSKVEKKMEQVKNWQEEPLKKLNLATLKEQKFVFNDNPFVSPKVWYDREQRNVAHNYYQAISNIAYNEKELLKPDLGKELKEFYEGQIENNKKKMEETKERFDKLQKADFDDVQEMALEEVEGLVDEKKSDAHFVLFWNIFFLLLIPVYIFAARPRGYTISRYRREADNLGTVEKIGLWLSGGLLTAGMGIGFVNIVTKWSDGSTTSEDDGTGPVRLAIKVGLFVAAALVFCAVSCFLMLYAAIAGLIRNYDWKSVKNRAVAAGKAAKSKINK